MPLLIRIILPKAIKQQMLEHASATPTVEVCGLLGGIENRVRHYYPVKNISEQSARAFYMDPQGQLDAMSMMNDRDEELMAIFHSHPDSSALPSTSDIELAAYPEVFNIIVSMRDNPKKLNSFRYKGKNFSRISIKETSS